MGAGAGGDQFPGVGLILGFRAAGTGGARACGAIVLTGFSDAEAFLHVVGGVDGAGQSGEAQGRTQGEDEGRGGQFGRHGVSPAVVEWAGLIACMHH